VFSPNPLDEDLLHGVAAISANDAWAVGQAFTEGGPTQPVIERWNGAAWAEVPTSLPDEAILYDASAVAPDDLWAVGSDFSGAAFSAHWDGSSWTAVPTAPLPQGGYFLGVDALASDDVWAVGVHGFLRTLVEHWDGSSWTVMPSPNPDDLEELTGVSGTAATDVWAVGWHSKGQGNVDHHPLIEHWNGSRWSLVKSYRPGRQIQLTDVVSLSSTNAWAVGFTGFEGYGETFVERWNGSSWQLVHGPPQSYELNAVAAGSSDDIWMVGVQSSGQTLTEHWDGTSLEVVPSYGWGDDHLEAVDVLASGEAWAAGWYWSDVGRRFTETLHFVPC
jgi:hypothetical protein